MTQLDEFLALLGHVRECRDRLLPAVNPTASYTDEEVMRMLGFRVLVHAEIESFLESVAIALVDAYNAKLKTAMPQWAREHFDLHGRLVTKYPPTTLSYSPGTNEKKQITGLLKQHMLVIEGNNGATERDVLKLFVPLGFSIGFFSRDWLQSMTELGRRRGDVAHNPSRSVAIQPTPEGEKLALVDPIFGLRALAREADRILSRL